MQNTDIRIRLWEREPTKVKVEAYYSPTIEDIVQVLLEADSKEQWMFFNLLAEWFNRFNEVNPWYRNDSQLVSIWLEWWLSDEAKEFIERLDIFANERF